MTGSAKAELANLTGTLEVLQDGELRLSEGARALLGERIHTLDDLLVGVLAADRESVSTLLRSDRIRHPLLFGYGHSRIRITTLDVPERRIRALRDETRSWLERTRMTSLARQLDLVERTSNTGTWHVDAESEELSLSDVAYETFGMEPGVEGLSGLEAIRARLHPEDRADLQMDVQRTMAGERVPSRDIRLRGRDGHERILRICLAADSGHDGRHHGLIGAIRDVTEELALSRHHDRLVSIVGSTDSASAADPSGRLVWVNEGFTRMMGFDLDEVVGRRPGELLQGPGTDPETVERMRAKLAAEQPFSEELLNYRKDGTPVWIRVNVSPQRDRDGKVVGWTSVQTDVTELRATARELENSHAELREALLRLEQQHTRTKSLLEENVRARKSLQRQVEARAALEEHLRKMALYDPLTGLASRRHVLGRLQTELARARRYARPLSVLMVDIDHFKAINDTWGHAVGDEALKHLANLFGETLRDSDCPGRVGGEEFVIVLPETDATSAHRAAERLRIAIEDHPLEHEETILRLTVSIGVGEAAGTETSEDILKRIDAALYEAKHGGRNRSVLAAPVEQRRSA